MIRMALAVAQGSRSAGDVEFMLLQEKLTDFTPSVLFVYYNERVIEHSTKSDAGQAIRDGIKTLAKKGVCDSVLWPFDPNKVTKKPTCSCYKQAKQNIILQYEKLSNITEYKSVLSTGFPFVFGFTVYESFESDEVTKTGIVPMPGPNEQPLGGHAVMCVGHDDNKQWFIVRNSWGASWGDKGYFYLPYAYFTPDLTDDFWVINNVK